MSSIMLLLVILSSIVPQFTESIGVCYGVHENNLPSRQEVIDLYKSNRIGKMRIYYPVKEALRALKGLNIEVLLDVGNSKETFQSLSDFAAAKAWVNRYVASYLDVNIKYIAIGNEINPGEIDAQYILPAMQSIQKAISTANLQGKIKISTVITMDLLENTYPPKNGVFKGNARQYIEPIIHFLVNSRSPILANVYPYFAYIDGQIPLEYALFTQEGTNEVGYQNLFDAMVDSIYAALEKIGASNLQIVVSESGRPSAGRDGATSVDNARTYYQNLINHVKGGTPKRNRPIETYLFAMLDENEKPGSATEKHLGLFNHDKSPKYRINFN